MIKDNYFKLIIAKTEHQIIALFPLDLTLHDLINVETKLIDSLILCDYH